MRERFKLDAVALIAKVNLNNIKIQIMANIFVLNDFSPTMPWNLATIHSNKVWLAENNIELAPFLPFTSESLPTHSALWSIYKQNTPTPQRIKNVFAKMLGSLESGKNLLLLNLNLYLPAHQSFQALLASEEAFAKHELKPIFVIGRPIVVYEQRWRHAGNIAENQRLGHARIYPALSTLIEYALEKHGASNVALLADRADNPKAMPQPELTARIFSALNCPIPEEPTGLPDSQLIFGSSPARQIYNARKVRFNNWPWVDDETYRKCLLNLDNNWDNSPISPLELRKMLFEEGRQSREKLEALLGLEPEALEAPSWLLEEEALSDSASLEVEKARDFASSLPADQAALLAKRLRQDEAILAPDQQCLLGALKKRPENEFKLIGAAQPPIELTVLTMTYNQEKYIGQCMDSVLAQKTPFPVQHLVLDHCSSDATPRIIAEYAKKNPSIRPILLDRHFYAENVRSLFLRCRSKYAAICDGDDYFTDPRKLHRQLDFLETHSKCALVSHPVKVIYENSSKEPTYYPSLDSLPRGLKEEYYPADLFNKNFIQTNSVMYRWRFIDGLPDWFRADLCPGDWYWHLLHTEMGKIGFIPDVMSVYRRHEQAMYVNSGINLLEHRKKTGLAELETYKAVDEHFKGRYFNRISNLANSVLAYFLLIYQQSGDNLLLQTALEKYPKFGKSFLAKIKEEERGRGATK